MATTTLTSHTTRRRAEQPQCKCCSFPLAPWQQGIGVCTLCLMTMEGVAAAQNHGPEDFEHYCQSFGFRG